MKKLRILLILVALVCIGVAVSYPIRYKQQLDTVEEEFEDLSQMRRAVLEAEASEAPAEAATTEAPVEAHVEAVTQAPVEAATEAPVEAVTQVSVEAATEVPVEAVTQVPVQAATEAPVEAVTQAPAQAEQPTQAPAEDQVTQTPQVPTDTPRPTPTPLPTLAMGGADRTATPEEVVEAIEGFTEWMGGFAPTPTPGIMDLIINDPDMITPTPRPTATPKPTATPTPSPTPDRKARDDADPYQNKEKVVLDEDKILPELKDIYALNHDLVGWIYIEGTNIDYPVVQHWDRQYYLSRDFYGNPNSNGQIILDTGCDPYTPSYNLILSGHHMNSGAMFGLLQVYKDYEFWEGHKIAEFDSLMFRKQYVVFAAFYSADYDEHEEGFRYSVNIQYKRDFDAWLADINAYKIYDTHIDVEFGDEFITMTTCDHSRRSDGRFVVVARRIREGETIE